MTNLSPRHKQLLELVALGYPNSAISSEMGITVRSVTSYLEIIYLRLGVNNRIQAVREAYKLGQIKGPSKNDQVYRPT